MKAQSNPERKSTRRRKQKTFEHKASCVITRPFKSDYDVTFFVGLDVFRGHQYVFAEYSNVLRKYFEFPTMDCEFSAASCYTGVVRRLMKSHADISLRIDAQSAAFECVHNFCYSGMLSVPVELVPAVYTLASRLQIPTIQEPCAAYLVEHIADVNIGEVCHIVQLTPFVDGTADNMNTRLLPTERHLAQSVFAYIRENADSIACSLSGQLGARLIVNLTAECNSSCISVTDGDYLPAVDSQLAFAVLLWAHERVLSGERLARTGSEENVQPDDEESDGCENTSRSTAYGPKPKRPGEPSGLLERLHVLGGVSASSNNANKDSGLSASLIQDETQTGIQTQEPFRYPLDTPDVRITLDLDELPSVELWRSGPSSSEDLSKDGSNGGGKRPPHLIRCPPNVYPESETCLLAATSLSVRSTSIWLGKLVGYLVSLSIKLYRPTSTSSTSSSSRSSVHNLIGEIRHQLKHSRAAGISPSGSVDTFSSSDEKQSICSSGPSHELDDDEVSRTVTAVSGSSLAKAALTSLSIDDTSSSSARTIHRNGNEAVVYYAHMLEAKAGVGGGSLSVRGNDYLMVVGGFTRKGCLDSVELCAAQNSSDTGVSTLFLSPTFLGPRLNKPRGRLAIACTRLDHSNPDSAVLYACGGSTGSTDLNSVEKLTPDALDSWLSTWHPSDESVAKAHHSSSIAPSAIANVWTFVANLHQPRSSPAAIGLSGLLTGPTISDTRGCVVVAGGVTGAAALSTAEAYVASRDQWVALPNMCEDRSEGACGLLSSKNLIVIAGGNSSTYRRNNYSGIVEALDPRCSAWMSVPSPSFGGQGKLRGCALLTNPSNRDELILLGGFNGQDTLNTIWIFDSKAWRWTLGHPMSMARASFCCIPFPDLPYVMVCGGFNGAASANGFLDSVEVISSADLSLDRTDQLHHSI